MGGFLGSPRATAILSIGLAGGLLILAPSLASLKLAGDRSGYAPEQPVLFSHRLHAGELTLGCLYCHGGAEKSRHAGLPAAAVCMNCHKTVTASWAEVRAEGERADKEKRSPATIISPELAKLRSSLEPAPGRPLGWIRVHDLPDFAYFDHRPHVGAGVACQTCHGAVQGMEVLRQDQDLSMGLCVNCHRDLNATGLPDGRPAHAPTDCCTCHF